MLCEKPSVTESVEALIQPGFLPAAMMATSILPRPASIATPVMSAFLPILSTLPARAALTVQFCCLAALRLQTTLMLSCLNGTMEPTPVRTSPVMTRRAMVPWRHGAPRLPAVPCVTAIPIRRPVAIPLTSTHRPTSVLHRPVPAVIRTTALI